MTAPVRERIERYLEHHPEASVPEVLGQFDLAPDQRDLVEDVLEQFAIANSTSSDEESTDEPVIVEPEPEVPVDEQCANPHCHERRLHPHPDSLCRKHYPAAAPVQQANVDDVQEDSDDGLDEAELEAMAETVTSPDQDAPTVNSASVASDSKTDSTTDAASFMGGGSPLATQPESEAHPTQDRMPVASGGIGAPTSALPLSQLDKMSPEQRRRAARDQGHRWPTTDEVRDRLEETIFEVMRHEDHRVVDAPTSAGKSFTVATTRWGARDDLTGDRPVVHLSETRDARDEAVEAAEQHGGDHMVLYGRSEACPVAAGHYDPSREHGDLPDVPGVPDEDLANPWDHEPITVDGVAASEVIRQLCEERGVAFSVAHRYVEQHNDQETDLPCHDQACGCWAINQWEHWRNNDYPLVLATHNFAHVPGLRLENNVVVDEQPDFRADNLKTERVRKAVSAYLRAADAPVQTWEQFLTMARYEGYGDDAAREQEQLESALEYEPDREWYLEADGAHTMAPALARAIYRAEPRANGRYAGKTLYEPPRLDANAHEEDTWNREWLSVVLDEDNNIELVRSTPDFQASRSVIGLDAHPALPLWRVNTVPWIDRREVLDRSERQLWRRYERGLRVVQVGEATRPPGAEGEFFDWDGASAVVEHLREKYGDDFATAITASATEQDLRDIMRQHGIEQPETMHFGEEKSRNDFADEQIGLVHGCIDPGDDYVLNILAERDLNAEPERSDTECDHCEGDGCAECDGTGHHRAHGRGWTGEDADAAQEILASVRENHTAQSAGRYARNPDDPESTATVFVRTDAMPAGFADVQVDGVVWTYTATQTDIIETFRAAAEPLSTREVADRVGCTKEHVRTTLQKLMPEDEDETSPVQAFPGEGEHGATLYAVDAVPNSGVVDLEDASLQTANASVLDSYTWSLAIRDPDVTQREENDQQTLAEASRPTIWEGDQADPGGG